MGKVTRGLRLYKRALTLRHISNGHMKGGIAALSGAWERFSAGPGCMSECPDECYESGMRHGFTHVHFME